MMRWCGKTRWRAEGRRTQLGMTKTAEEREPRLELGALIHNRQREPHRAWA